MDEELKKLKQKINDNEFIYYCLKCNRYLGTLKTKECKNLKCRCKSRLITFISARDKQRVNTLRKHVNKEPFTKKEEKIFEDIMRRADMFLSYDYMAPLTMSAKGVGTRKAIRILGGYYKTERDYLKKLFEECSGK